MCLLLESGGFVAAIAHQERRSAVGQFKQGAIAPRLVWAQVHPVVDVGVHQRGQVEQATEQDGSFEPLSVKTILFLPATGQDHCCKMPAGRAAGHNQFLTVAVDLRAVALHPSDCPTRLIHDVAQVGTRGQRVIDSDHRHARSAQSRSHKT